MVQMGTEALGDMSVTVTRCKKLKVALWDTLEHDEIPGIIEHNGNIAIVVEIMTGSKKRSRCRKKRRGKRFGGSRRKEKSKDEASVKNKRTSYRSAKSLDVARTIWSV